MTSVRSIFSSPQKTAGKITVLCCSCGHALQGELRSDQSARFRCPVCGCSYRSLFHRRSLFIEVFPPKEAPNS